MTKMWGLSDVIRNCVCQFCGYSTNSWRHVLIYSHSRYSHSLQDGRSGVRIQVGSEIFRIRPHRPWGPPSLLYRVSFPRAKRPNRGVDHPPPSSAEVKKRVKLYLYSLCASAARYRENFPAYITECLVKHAVTEEWSYCRHHSITRTYAFGRVCSGKPYSLAFL